MAQSTWVSRGSVLHSPPLSEQMRMQAEPFYVYRQFSEAKDGLGANAGEAVQFSKQLRIDTRGGTLVETTTMPVNEIVFLKDSVTVTEYGNGVQYTQKIDTLSEFNMRDQFQKGIVQDQVDVIDRAIAAIYQTGEFKAVCTAAGDVTFTTNGTATATSTANPNDTSIRKIVSYAKKKHIPKIGGNYVAILSVEAHQGVYDTLQAVAQYADPSFRFTDETGRYYGVRFIEDNNVLSNVLGHATTGTYGEGVLFGDEAVCEAVALPEELRFEETDVGRSKKLAWYSILGFKKTWSLSSDDSNSTGNGIERIIHITSKV